ncbi:hypothetical protein GQ53DRAFT_839982 [Thozetella sp. PMI_491]|nr:hypothetical protein GQ53DRAFT_839982 [Thozetella sp. PMI_491]
MYGLEKMEGFINLGFELWGDRETLQAKFLVGDFFDKSLGGTKELQGSVDIVHLALFLHLFERNKQVEACERIIEFLKPEPGVLIWAKDLPTSQLHNVGLWSRQLLATSSLDMTRSLRSRTGCWTCREDGYKCDEQKPSCGRCRRLGRRCKGYGIRLKWQEPLSLSSRLASKNAAKNSPVPNIPRAGSLNRILDVAPRDQRLLHHWQTVLIGSISMSGGVDNPFLVHLTPLLPHSPALRSVIASMAAGHLAVLRSDTSLGALAIQHRLRGVNLLRQSIADSAPELSLAAILLLQISERTFVTDSGVDHLEGAKALIRQHGGQMAWSSSLGQFLLGLCSYHDILSSVSKGRPPLLDFKEPLVEGLPKFSKLSSILYVVGEITRLWSVPGDHLRDGEYGRVILARLILMEEVEPLDEDSRNVEVFRQSALIYLYRSTARPNDFQDQIILHADLCLQHMAKIPCSSPLVTSHILPLWTAGCETVQPPLREFVLQRLDDMFETRRLPYIQRIKQDTLRVWQVKDGQRQAKGKVNVDCIKVIRASRGREADII